MRFGATNTGNRAEPVHPQVEGAGARVDRSYNHFDKVEACKLLRPHPGLANQSLARHTDRVGACGSPTRSRPIITVVYPASAIWSGHALERERRVRTFPSTADRNLALIAVLPV